MCEQHGGHEWSACGVAGASWTAVAPLRLALKSKALHETLGFCHAAPKLKERYGAATKRGRWLDRLHAARRPALSDATRPAAVQSAISNRIRQCAMPPRR